MKREGRQHGLVRTCRILPSPLNPRPETRFVNRFDSPATAGLFTRVSSKPTNHSKFTGKCGQPRCNGCHLHPSCKAKDKTKGTQKLKSNDVVSNHRLLTWRVVEGRTGLNFSGSSATRILDQLSNCHMDDNDIEEEVGDVDYDYDDGPNSAIYVDDPTVNFEPIKSRVEREGEEVGYSDVGFVLDKVEGEDGWCMVGPGEI